MRTVLSPSRLSADLARRNGLLTAAQKLNRKQINDAYKDEIKACVACDMNDIQAEPERRNYP